MRTIAFAVLFLACALAPAARANTLNTTGLVGYESIDVEHGDLKFEHSGMNFGLGAQYAFTDLFFLDLVLGAGLKFSWLTGEATIAGIKTESRIRQPMFSVEGGVGTFAFSPLLSFQGTIGYDFGFFGVNTVEVTGKEEDEDLEKFGRLTFNARAFYRAAPTLDLGLQYSYLQGSLRSEDGNTLDTDGFTIGLAVRTAFSLPATTPAASEE